MPWQDGLMDTWQTTLVFFSLLLFARLLGKTQISQLTYYEYISGITIGSIAANIVAADPDKVWRHYYDLSLFVALTYLLSFITIKNRSLRIIFDGMPIIVVENGRILKKNMRSMRYDLDALIAQLREKGILDISEVQFAIVENNGNLSVIKKSEYQPVTKSDIKLQVFDRCLPIELIMDGQVIETNLRQAGISHDWLKNQIALRGINQISKVTYAVLDSKGQLFVSVDSLER